MPLIPLCYAQCKLPGDKNWTMNSISKQLLFMTFRENISTVLSATNLPVWWNEFASFPQAFCVMIRIEQKSEKYQTVFRATFFAKKIWMKSLLP